MHVITKRPAALGRSRQSVYNERYRQRWQNDPEHRARKTRANRDYKMRTQYGITLVEFEQMVEDQNHLCACCGVAAISAETVSRRHAERSVVDHCHSTGRVRGILCQPCNLMLGYAKDNVETLRRAASYLEG